MAQSEGAIVFKRGRDRSDDSDIWDDTALIKAYDDAINLVKAQFGQESEDSSAKNDKNHSISKKKKQKQKRHKKKERNLKLKPTNAVSLWHVGDSCEARFSEDGLIYPAIVKSVDLTSQTCVVRYAGYGNEEEQYLADLIQPENGADSICDDSISEKSSVAGVSHHSSTPKQDSKRSSHQSSKNGPRSFPGFTNMPPPPPPLMNMRMPIVPPPPPPIMCDRNNEEDDALCSMLMAWYMSGYHTGYYQGLKESQKNNHHCHHDHR